MRGDLIERLANSGIDGGMLALLGSVGAAARWVSVQATNRGRQSRALLR